MSDAEKVEILKEALMVASQAAYAEIVDDCGRTMAQAAAHAVKTVQREAFRRIEEN